MNISLMAAVRDILTLAGRMVTDIMSTELSWTIG
jgi:hypothetical protein